MPEIDGMEACRRIKPVEALRDIPVIMMTTRSPEEVLWVAFDASATDYIKKPFEEVELLARVKTTLKLKKEIDARKNWEQELTKTISELDAAFHEMVTLQQLIPILSRLQETAGRPGPDSPLSKPIFRPTPMPSSITRSVPPVRPARGSARIVQNRGSEPRLPRDYLILPAASPHRAT